MVDCETIFMERECRCTVHLYSVSWNMKKVRLHLPIIFFSLPHLNDGHSSRLILFLVSSGCSSSSPRGVSIWFRGPEGRSSMPLLGLLNTHLDVMMSLGSKGSHLVQIFETPFSNVTTSQISQLQISQVFWICTAAIPGLIRSSSRSDFRIHI